MDHKQVILKVGDEFECVFKTDFWNKINTVGDAWNKATETILRRRHEIPRMRQQIDMQVLDDKHE